MSIEALSIINELLTENDIPYEFLEWSHPGEYPYFVGSYTEAEPMYENGESDTNFIITGFSRGSALEMMQFADVIRDIFTTEGVTYVTPDGTGVALYYAGAFPIPSDDEDLKRMQINLKVKEWRE